MEEMPKKITNLEIDKNILENQDSIKETEISLKEGIEVLKDEIRLMQNDIDYLNYLESSNETADSLNEMAEELGKDKLRKHSDEEINKIKVNIQNAQKSIDEIGRLIMELTLQKVELSHYIEEFEKLNEQFRINLLKINKENLN
jgi:hypothetical protein